LADDVLLEFFVMSTDGDEHAGMPQAQVMIATTTSHTVDGAAVEDFDRRDSLAQQGC
jgi:hypothetical protein